MTTYVPAKNEARIAREEARRARVREARIRKVRKLLWMLICWVEEATTDLPAKIKRGAMDTFTCMICIILFGALFFACLGLLELAFTFWGDLYFG